MTGVLAVRHHCSEPGFTSTYRSTLCGLSFPPWWFEKLLKCQVVHSTSNEMQQLTGIAWMPQCNQHADIEIVKISSVQWLARSKQTMGRWSGDAHMSWLHLYLTSEFKFQDWNNELLGSEAMFEKHLQYSIVLDRKISSKSVLDGGTECLVGTYRKLNIDWIALFIVGRTIILVNGHSLLMDWKLSLLKLCTVVAHEHSTVEFWYSWHFCAFILESSK